MKHDVLHTGGNIYHDYISDFDDSGRVIVLTCDDISLYASDRDYQVSAWPIARVYLSDMYSNGEADESDAGFIFEIQDGEQLLVVYHANNLSLQVFKVSE